MNGVKQFFLTAVFAASSLSLFAGHVNAQECPSEDFVQFMAAFSTTAKAQQRLTAMTVKSLTLKPTTLGQFEPSTTGVRSSKLGFPLMAPVTSGKTEGVEIEQIDDSHFNVVDKRAGNSNIKVFNFSRQACWVLEGIEDWSISEKDLTSTSKQDMSAVQNFCFQRAEAYAGLGGLQQYPLTKEFFEAALENYVCAAASGDPQASLNAASLSLSGMAPSLESEQVEALYKAAATTLPDGAAGLSTFYCYGNNPAAEGPCQHPAKAEEALVRAASMGSIDAINYLGYAFEKGQLATQDTSRALACYRLAAGKGNASAATNLDRLEKQASEVKASYCY